MGAEPMAPAKGIALSDALEWMPANQAVAELSPLLGGTVATKKELADRLKDGGLRARAAQRWVIETGSVARAWRTGPDADADAEFDVEIETSVWRSSQRWSADQVRWRWPKNSFSITRRVEPRKSIMLEGVSFSTEDIETIKRSLSPSQGTQREPSRAGRKPNWRRWALLTKAVMDLDRDGALKVGDYDSPKDLRDTLLSMINEKLSVTSIDEYASFVFNELMVGRSR